MPTYTYRVLSAEGRSVTGTGEAASVSEMEDTLRARGLYPLEVSLEAGPADEGSRRPSARRGRGAAVARFFRHLSTLVSSGVSLDRALRIGARATSRNDLAEALSEVRADVREGGALAEALGAHPGLFPPLAVGLTRAGERGGALAEAFDRVARALERRRQLRSRLRTALIYPSVMALVSGVSLAVLLFWVLPRFTVMLEEMGVALPASTAILVGVTGFVEAWWPVMLAAGVGTAVWLARFWSTERGRELLHGLCLRLPLLGPLRRQRAAVNLGRTLAALLERGMPVLEAMETTGEALTDRVARRELAAARREVRAGHALARAFRGGRALPEAFLQMVEVGEEGGRLDEMLRHGAEMMEEDLRQGLERLVRLAEPAMIVVFGAAVGFVALALLQAVYGVHAGGLP